MDAGRQMALDRQQHRIPALAIELARAALVPPGTSLTHAALQYTLAHPAISTSIPGAKSVAQALDNFAAADRQLPADVVRAIDALWENKIKSDPLPW